MYDPSPVTYVGGKFIQSACCHACSRARSVYANHAELIGVVHVLSSRTHRDRRRRDAVGLIGRSSREGEVVAALLAASENRVNQVCRS